jgi:capsule biosynthesis phosphatase
MTSDVQKETYVFDLDGTICEIADPKTYGDARARDDVLMIIGSVRPRKDVVDLINRLWGQGHDIVIHTARGMRSFSGDVSAIEHMYRRPTEEWLQKNRVCYNRLVFGKPSGDRYVDDKALTPEEFVREFSLRADRKDG